MTSATRLKKYASASSDEHDVDDNDGRCVDDVEDGDEITVVVVADVEHEM